MKKVWRSDENKVIFGVMGGLGDYFDTDPVVLRVGYVFLSFLTGVLPGLLAYIVAGMVMPLKKETS